MTPARNARPDSSPSPQRRSGSRWPRRLGILLVVALLAIAILPNLLCWLMPGTLVSVATGELSDRIEVRSISASWWSPIQIRDLNLLDEQDRPIVQVPLIETERSLFSLMTSSDVGTIHLHQPRVDCQIRPGGSNLEDALENLLDPSAESSPAPRMRIEISAGVLRLSKQSLSAPASSSSESTRSRIANVNEEIEILDLQAELILGQGPDTVQFSSSGQISLLADNASTDTGDTHSAAAVRGDETTLDLASPGRFQIQGMIELSPAAADTTAPISAAASPGSVPTGSVDSAAAQLQAGNNGQLTATLENVPLQSAQWVATWLEWDTQLAGQLSGEFDVRWADAFDQLQFDIRSLAANNVSMRDSSWAQGESLLLNRLAGQGALRLEQLGQSPRIDAQQLQLQSEWFELRGNGQLAQESLLRLVQHGELPPETWNLEGQVDVAQLAAMLPSTLSFRPGIEIQSGQLAWTAFSRREADAQRLLVDAELKNMQASEGQRQFGWHEPVRLLGSLRASPQQFQLEQLRIESPAISISGHGSSQQALLEARGDLAEFASELNQFFDLQQIRLRGKFGGKLAWTPQASTQLNPDQQPMSLQASLRVIDADIEFPGWGALREPELILKAAARGSVRLPSGLSSLPTSPAASESGPATPRPSEPLRVRFDQAAFEFQAGSDRLTFNLDQPTAELGWEDWARTSFPGTLELSGQLASWHQRWRQFLPTELQGPLSGQIQLRTRARLGGDEIQIAECNYQLNDLQFDGLGLQVREPQATGQASLRIDLINEQCQVLDVTWAGSALAARVGNTRVDYGTPWAMVGQVAFQSDLTRASLWVPSLAESDYRYAGLASGQLQIESQAQAEDTPQNASLAYRGNLSVQVDNLSVRSVVAGAGAAGAGVGSGGANPTDELWQEPQAQFQAEFTTIDFDRYDFSQLALESKAASASLTGSLHDVAGLWQMDLAGRWSPNWQFVSALASSLAEQPIEIRGQLTEDIRINGPLFAGSEIGGDSAGASAAAPQFPQAWFPAELTLQTHLAWDHASVNGLELEQAHLPLELQGSIVSIKPTDIGISASDSGSATTVSNSAATLGVARLDLALDLRHSEPVLYLQPGSQLRQVQLTPEICHGWLKYVAPPLAEATRVAGSFSADFDGVALPLYDMTRGSGSGTIGMQTATVSSGPLADQVLQMASTIKQLARGGDLTNLLANNGLLGGSGNPDPSGQATLEPAKTNTWVTMPEQKIAFRWQQGRVFTQGTTFEIDDVKIQSQGSIGLDQSIELVTIAPIQDEWIRDRAELQFLRGQSLQVPIRGTLTQPRLDTDTLRQISRQFIRQGAGNLLRDQLQNQFQDKLDSELKKGLDKLFNRK